MSLEDAFERYLPQVEAELQEIVRIPHHSLAAYYGMMHYHLSWVDSAFHEVEARGGKRIRPLICLLCARAAGGEAAQALPAAAALELVHNFSLVHDDIQDGSHYRRGRRAYGPVGSGRRGGDAASEADLLDRFEADRSERALLSARLASEAE